MLNNSYKTFLLVCLSLFISACSEPTTEQIQVDSKVESKPEAGKQYRSLDNDLSDLNLAPITEVFSLTCGHCRNMEKALPEIEALTEQKIGKVHVTFNQSAQVSAMLYYAAEMQLNKQPDHGFTEQLFALIQQHDGTMDERKTAIEKVFTDRQLITPYQLNEQQINKLTEYLDLASTVTEKGHINAVPSFIIKGKYMLITEGHKDIKDLANTINYLLSQPE